MQGNGAIQAVTFGRWMGGSLRAFAAALGVCLIAGGAAAPAWAVTPPSATLDGCSGADGYRDSNFLDISFGTWLSDDPVSLHSSYRVSNSVTIANLAEGDRIVANVHAYGSVALITFSDSKSTVVASASGVQLIYTVSGLAAPGSLTITASDIMEDGSNSGRLTISCTSASASAPGALPPDPPSDSDNIQRVQDGLTPVVGQTSGAAIDGAVGGAIGNSFEDAFGGSPLSMGAGGASFFFDPAAMSGEGHALAFAPAAKAPGVDAVTALAYGGSGPSPAQGPATAALARPSSNWRLWGDLRWTGLDGGDGSQVNGTAGITYKLTPDMLAGVFGGFETFDYTASSLSGTLKGDGLTLGGYFARRFGEALRFDAMTAWTGLSYDATAGTASGSFDASRWLVSTGLTGRQTFGRFVVEPSGRVFALTEGQDAWTDSLAADHAARSYWTGRGSAGVKIAYPMQMADGLGITPSLGIYGDYGFGYDNATGGIAGVNGGSARFTGGLAFATAEGATASFDGEFGGVGGSRLFYSAKGRFNLPF